MTFKVYIGEAVCEEMYSESGILEIFASVADAVFCGYSADIYVGGIKKFKNLSKGLLCIIKRFKTRVLLGSFIAAFVKSKLFADVWCEAFMNL